MPDWFTGDNSIIAGLTAALGWFVNEWRLERKDRRESEAARNEEGKAAANALFEQRLVNERSLARIERLEDRIEDMGRDLDKCERENERWRTSPPKEMPA